MRESVPLRFLSKKKGKAEKRFSRNVNDDDDDNDGGDDDDDDDDEFFSAMNRSN